MKKFLFSILCLFCAVMVQAEVTSTVTFSDLGYTNGLVITDKVVTLDDVITITFASNGGGTSPAYYNSGTAIRLYSKNSMTIVADGATINSVEMKTGSGSNAIDKSICTISSGELSVDGTTANITNINAGSVTLTRGGSSGHFRIASLKVTYVMNAGEEPGVQTVTAPVIEESCIFTESMEVSLSCAIDGATIHYTTDGSEPTEESAVYSAPITITETTTVKAIAVKEGMKDSKVVEATYTKVEPSSWKLVTDAEALNVGDKVVLVSSVSDFAMSTNQKSNNRGAVKITKSDDDVIISDEVQILTLEEGTKSGTFAFYTGSGYLYAASSDKNYLRTNRKKDDNGSWKITISSDGVASIIAQGSITRNVMQYNQSSTLFSCYATASQKAINIYKEVTEQTPEEAYELNINKYGYATLYLDKAVAVPEGLAAYYCTVDGTTAVLHEVGEVIPAATAVVLKGEANTTYTLANTAELNDKAETIKAENKLFGWAVDTRVEMDANGYYALNVKDGVVGFFVPQTVSADKASFTAMANKAYLKIEGAANAQMLTIREGADGGETSVESAMTDVSVDKVYYDLTGRRVENPKQGIYIVNGRKVVIR